MIEDALRRELAAARTGGERPTVPVFDAGTGPRPGIDLTSNTVLSEVLDEGLELNSRK
ncbi:antitoxin [Mycobacterium tuberculosis]|nr:antitoxin [Mycobacterium tuberculosis]